MELQVVGTLLLIALDRCAWLAFILDAVNLCDGIHPWSVVQAPSNKLTASRMKANQAQRSKAINKRVPTTCSSTSELYTGMGPRSILQFASLS